MDVVKAAITLSAGQCKPGTRFQCQCEGVLLACSMEMTGTPLLRLRSRTCCGSERPNAATSPCSDRWHPHRCLDRPPACIVTPTGNVLWPCELMGPFIGRAKDHCAS